MTRRSFLATSGAALMAAPANAIPLGFDAYSIRDFHWKASKLIDYAASLKLDAVQISIHEFDSLKPAGIAALREQAKRAGITVEAGMASICPSSSAWNPRNGTPEAYLRLAVAAAKAMGCKTLRCFLGSQTERKGALPIEAHLDNTLKVLRAVRSEILDAGIRIAIENHKDMTARELRALLDTAGTDYTGACLDIGNPLAIAEDPALAIEVLGPVAITTHIRDTALFEDPRGAQFQWVALGDGSIGLDNLMDLYRRICPTVPVHLEIITGRPPEVVPCLEESYWKLYPKVSAADFARFANLARRGHPYTGPMIVTAPGKQPPEFAAALREQQRLDLERSLRHAHEKLGLGVRANG